MRAVVARAAATAARRQQALELLQAAVAPPLAQLDPNTLRYALEQARLNGVGGSEMEAVRLVLDLLRQLDNPPGAPRRLVKGRSVAWLDENLPALSFADAVACRAAMCTRDENDDEICAICLDELDCDLGAEIGGQIGGKVGEKIGGKIGGEIVEAVAAEIGGCAKVVEDRCRLLACSHIFHKSCVDQWRAHAHAHIMPCISPPHHSCILPVTLRRAVH